MMVLVVADTFQSVGSTWAVSDSVRRMNKVMVPVPGCRMMQKLKVHQIIQNWGTSCTGYHETGVAAEGTV
jgi:hypothetical protein